MQPVGREGGGMSSWEPYNNSALPLPLQPNHIHQPQQPIGSSAPLGSEPPIIHRGNHSLPHHLQQSPDSLQHQHQNHLGSTQSPSTYLPYHQNHIHYPPPPPHQLVSAPPPPYGSHHGQVSSMSPMQQQPPGIPLPHHPSQHVVPSQSHHVPISSHLQSAPIHQYLNPQSQQPPQTSQHQPFSLKLPANSPQQISGPLTPTPVPHTPQGVPAVNPFNNGPGGNEHDLHPDLLALGWRKFWSKRENRWYFWNCTTGESLWEVPTIPGRHPSGHNLYDPLTDPLGIQCNNGSGVVNVGSKRRASSGEFVGSPVIKKFILAGPWDLEIASNVYSGEVAAPQPHLLPPHPEVEQTRSQLVAKLRQCYQQSCASREGIDAPKESLNRWILERKVTDLRGIDPIFPSCDNADGIVSLVMMKEIMNDIPMKIVKPRFTGDARKQLAKFAEACKKTIETRSASSEARKIVKWKVDETFSWLKSTLGQPYESFQERLAHLKVTCQPHVHTAAKSSVEGICKKMSLLAKQYAQNVRESHCKLLVEPENVKQDYEPEKCRVRCHPALCGTYSFTEAGRLPQIDFLQTDRDHAVLKFRNDAVKITTQYLQKLEQLYRYNCVDDRKFEFFLARSYCLLKRYNSYCEDFTSSQSTQGSLPVPVFESIQRNFGVTFECFSSPLNCYFRQHCSAFPDTDGYFGSRGNFLNFFPVSGSFEMNPPFSEELIDAGITHAEELLAGTREPMSFIIFVPEYTEEKDSASGTEIDCPWLKRLENSRWNRKQVTIPAYEHEYRHGTQHLVPKSEVSVRASHATVVFWLQNESGWEEWKPTEQKVDALIDCYRPGRERERDRQDLLSPERQNPHQADKAVAAAAAAAAI